MISVNSKSAAARWKSIITSSVDPPPYDECLTVFQNTEAAGGFCCCCLTILPLTGRVWKALRPSFPFCSIQPPKTGQLLGVLNEKDLRVAGMLVAGAHVDRRARAGCTTTGLEGNRSRDDGALPRSPQDGHERSTRKRVAR